MRFRTIGLMVTLALGILLAPLADAQQAARVPRLCFLGAFPAATRAHLWAAFLEGLHELGYIQGQNITIARIGGVELRVLEVRTLADIERAFPAAAKPTYSQQETKL